MEKVIDFTEEKKIQDFCLIAESSFFEDISEDVEKKESFSKRRIQNLAKGKTGKELYYTLLSELYRAYTSDFRDTRYMSMLSLELHSQILRYCIEHKIVSTNNEFSCKNTEDVKTIDPESLFKHMFSCLKNGNYGDILNAAFSLDLLTQSLNEKK